MGQTWKAPGRKWKEKARPFITLVNIYKEIHKKYNLKDQSNKNQAFFCYKSLDSSYTAHVQ